MCSQLCISPRSNIHLFQCTEWLHTSEEQEDIDDHENLNRGTISSSAKMPDELRTVLQGGTKIRRVKCQQLPRSKECQWQSKLKDLQQSSVLNSERELQAKRYSKVVVDDSLKNLRQTIYTAGSIENKGTAINNELARQERVLSKAEIDVAIAEYDTDQTTETLKGMKSLKAKLARIVWKKEPKLRINEFSKETRSFSNVNLNLLEQDVGLCTFSKMLNSGASSSFKDISKDTEGTQQTEIKAGIGQLHKTLDAITLQQKDTALALDQQEGRLSVFENRLTTTHKKINCQTQMITSIIRK